jgi:hypothetical protein
MEGRKKCLFVEVNVCMDEWMHGCMDELYGGRESFVDL